MSDKPRMELSESEAKLLYDLSYARMLVLKEFDPHSVENPPLHTAVDEHIARIMLPVFDFYRSVTSNNIEAVKLQAATKPGLHVGVGYYEGVIADYRAIINGLGISVEPVLELYRRMKTFIKGQKSPPPRILYISDCHFYDDYVNQKMDVRGFSGYEEMNEHMIAQWNQKVTARDSVYILGDFSIAKGDATEKIARRLNGKLYLIIGNHDRYLGDKDFDRNLFRSIEPYQEIRDNGRKVILSHYPVFCYNEQYRREYGKPRAYMLYGHVHNTHDEALINRFIRETRETTIQSIKENSPESIPCNMINCFCMFSNYRPMMLDEWIEIDALRRVSLSSL